MKIGIDISQVAYAGSGVARYTAALIHAITKTKHYEEFLFFYSSLRTPLAVNLKQEITKYFQLKELPIPPTVLNFMWNDLHIIPIETFTGKLDIFHTSDWVEPPAKAKKITTLHDLIPYKYPETSTQETTFDLQKGLISANIVETHKKRLRWVQKESTLILCDSESTKNDAHEILGIPDERMHVLYPAVEVKSPSEEQTQTVQKKYNLTKPFILTVGKIEPRKNIKKLIQAFTKAEFNNLELCVVGSSGWGDENELKDIKHVNFLGHISDADLYALYSLARCFIMPSLYEGFGFPIIEAMSLGCPVGASNTSSMKELTENYGLLFDPQSEEEIIDVIKQLTTDEILRNDLIEKGKERAKDFSLDHFYEKYIELIKSV